MRKKLFLLLLLVVCALHVHAQYGQTPPLHVDGKYLKDPHGNVVNLHGVMDTPNPYFNNYRWGNSCSSSTIAACRKYFNKLFTAITDTTQGAYCDLFRLHLDPCWTNDPSKPRVGEGGEHNISQFSPVRLKSYLRTLFFPIAKDGVDKGLYIIMRPPGVCPKDIKVGGEYQEYLMNVWDIVSSNDSIKKYAGVISLELANEPINCYDANGNSSPRALYDFFQPIVDKIRANGFTGIIWIPGTGYQSNYTSYATYPIEGYNIGYAVHNYPGWYGCSDKSCNPNEAISQFQKQVPVVKTNPIIITEVDWSPEKPGAGKYNEFGEWVPANYGTWATASTSKWGLAYKAILDHFGNIGMTLTGTADYIDIDAYIKDGTVKPAFGGYEECCAKACFDWYKEYSKVDYPRPDFKRKWTADNGDGTFCNPLINADFPDPDIIRVGDTYYLATTTMFYFPGVTILKSKDLVNWEYCANPLKQISDSAPYNLLDGLNHYSKGQWAPSLKYSNGTFYLNFIAFDHSTAKDGGDFLLTTTDPEGVWNIQRLDGFYYDSGFLFDDGENGTGGIYVASGIDNIYVAQLDKNFKEVKSQKVLSPGNGCEGSHFYHIGDYYYIYATYGGTEGSQTIFRAKDPFGPYEEHEGRVFEKQHIHQGGLVETQTGEWWTILFKDAGAIGRIPYLEPVEWKDGWPIIGNNGIDVGKNGAKYRKPNVGAVYPKTYLDTNDTFTTPTLGKQWQWNHNPNDASWSLLDNPGWMRLYTASVTDDFKQAQNTLTQRIIGLNKEGTAASDYTDIYGTVKLNVAGMEDGDVAGLCMFQDPYAYIGLKKENGKRYLVYHYALSEGNVVRDQKGEAIDSDIVYLRAVVNFGTNKATFYYSTDNVSYKRFGGQLDMGYRLTVFVGNRFAIFNYATKNIGGYVDVDWFSTESQFTEEMFYGEDLLKTFTKEDVTLKSLNIERDNITLVTGESASLNIIATYMSGLTANVSGTCKFSIDRPDVATIVNGRIISGIEGSTAVTATYTDINGNSMSVDFTVTVSTFPLTADAFNPSIYGTGTFVEKTGALTTSQYGFGGWKYNALNLSAYKYIVVKLRRGSTCQPSFRLYDSDNYWTTPYMLDMGTKKTIQVDLHNMIKSDGTKCDPSHLYIIGFWTLGGSAVYIQEVFLSNDGTTPVGIIAPTEDGLMVKDIAKVTYYDIAGRQISSPEDANVYIEEIVFTDGTTQRTKKYQ